MSGEVEYGVCIWVSMNEETDKVTDTADSLRISWVVSDRDKNFYKLCFYSEKLGILKRFLKKSGHENLIEGIFSQ